MSSPVVPRECVARPKDLLVQAPSEERVLRYAQDDS
jgi:hypothetical protein